MAFARHIEYVRQDGDVFLKCSKCEGPCALCGQSYKGCKVTWRPGFGAWHYECTKIELPDQELVNEAFNECLIDEVLDQELGS
jgi:hypothetical protein